MTDRTLLIANLEKRGHVDLCTHLSACEVDSFLALQEQLEGVDIERLGDDFEKAKEILDTTPPSIFLPPPTANFVRLTDADEKDKRRWKEIGGKAITGGKIAVCVLAGGQGTRLGYEGPKGAYKIGLPSGLSLFGVIASQLVRLKESRGITLRMYVMTSSLNHAATLSHFRDNSWFGLPHEHVVFFPQETTPCLTTEGQLMLSSPQDLATSPNGNGGLFRSLQVSGAITELEINGVEYVHVFAVDNPLVKVADPYFIGHCIANGLDVSNKACTKTQPDEKVGVFVFQGSRVRVVEYSEMTREQTAMRSDEGDDLVFSAGNICNHLFSIGFIKHASLYSSFPHLAHKKVPYYNVDKGEITTPSFKNAYKLEKFIFDPFCLIPADKIGVFEVPRGEEFSPVKNRHGDRDTPDAALLALYSRYARALASNGIVCNIDVHGEEDRLLDRAFVHK